MATIQLNVNDSIFAQALEHIKTFVSAHQNESKYFYIDEIGDTIEVINGKEYVVPTKEDLDILNAPISKKDIMSLDDLKKELCIEQILQKK